MPCFVSFMEHRQGMTLRNSGAALCHNGPGDMVQSSDGMPNELKVWYSIRKTFVQV